MYPHNNKGKIKKRIVISYVIINDMDNDLVQKQKQDIELTKRAYACSLKEYSHDEIMKIILSEDEIEKQICIINLAALRSKEEAQALVSNLTGHPTPVRELTSFKILEFLNKGEFIDYFQDENTLLIFLDGVIDINPSVSRNMVEILKFVENKKYCLDSLKIRIKKLIDEIREVPKNKSYIANKKNFSLYWYLEALYVLLEEQYFDDDYIEILDICSWSGEYTIREKCAKIVSKFKNHPALKDILQRLQNDENFYVLNRLNSN